MYDTYRTTYTVRPRLGAVERKGTPITEEQYGSAWAALAKSEKHRKRHPGEEHACGATDGTSKQAKDNDAAVIGFLSKQPGNADEIAAGTGLAAITVRVAIRRLRKAGHVIRNRRAKARFWCELEEDGE